MSWSCDGRRLASGSLDKNVCIFSLTSDRLNKEGTYRGHGDSVDTLRWHPDNPELLATASGDKTVRIWDSRTSKCVANIATKGENINISWSADGKTLAVGNKEDLVTFIDTQSQKICQEKQGRTEKSGEGIEEREFNIGSTFLVTNLEDFSIFFCILICIFLYIF